MSRNGFDEVFTQEGADKQSSLHGYDEFYEQEFGNWCAHPINLLEIGVYQGASIRSWLRLFPNGQITGIDVLPYDNPNPRFKHYVGSALDHAFLKKVAAERAHFNIIIDDGSHENLAQSFAFYSLWIHVAPGGVYVIEDIQPWFDQEQEKRFNGEWFSLVNDTLSNLNEHGRWYYGRPKLNPGVRMPSDIRCVTFRKGLMAIYKK